jgi:hypothetical protein
MTQWRNNIAERDAGEDRREADGSASGTVGFSGGCHEKMKEANSIAACCWSRPADLVTLAADAGGRRIARRSDAD